MTSRHEYSKTYLGPAEYEFLRPYDEYRRDSDGGNSARVNGRLVYSENGYTSHIQFYRNPPIQMSGWGPDGPWTDGAMFSLGAMPVPAEPIIFPSAYDVLPKLREKWRQSEFQVGVAAGESRETVKMMTDRIGSIYRAARALRKGHLQDSLRHMLGQVPKDAQRRAQKALSLGDFSGAWLENQLGWSPTINEVYNLAEHLSFVPPSTNRVKAAIVKRCPAIPAGGSSGMDVSGEAVWGTSVIIDVYRNPTEIERLGLADPAGVVWELTTLSFLLDYFVPIGNAIASFSSMAELPVQKVIVTEFLKFEGRVRVETGYVAGLWVKVPPSPTSVAISKTYTTNRMIGGSLHDVISALAWAPTIQVPKVDLSLRQLANTAALATQALHSLVNRSEVRRRYRGFTRNPTD